MSELAALIAEIVPEIVEFRHDLHAHPELGYQEVRTSGKVQEKLTAAGIEFRAGLAGGTGILGHLPATRPGGKTIALRADMDALPIIEDTGKPYSSQNHGVMHACGHDGHTSILVGAAKTLSKMTERPNDLLFVFQPAEEGGAGGKRMVEEGVLSGGVLSSKADVAFGLHGFPYLPVGALSTRVGPMMAAADTLEITVTGKGGHAAMPHSGIDPILVASHIVTALQSIVSRNVSPLDSAVITIAQFHAGTAHNIIPDVVELKGTLRTFRPATREYVRGRITALAEQIAAGFGAKAEVRHIDGYPVTANAESATATFKQILSDRVVADTEPVMGAEDFSFYGLAVPACFYWLGLEENGQKLPNLHSPQFDFTDAALPVGIEAMCRLALAA